MNRRMRIVRMWEVWTQYGVLRTVAATREGAVRNARWRLAMGGRSYSEATPADKAYMRDIAIYSVRETSGGTDGKAAAAGENTDWK